MYGIKSGHNGATDMTLAALNRKISAKFPGVELIRGEGYHYLTYTNAADPSRYDSETIMTPYTKDFSAARWLEEAKSFFERITGSN